MQSCDEPDPQLTMPTDNTQTADCDDDNANASFESMQELSHSLDSSSLHVNEKNADSSIDYCLRQIRTVIPLIEAPLSALEHFQTPDNSPQQNDESMRHYRSYKHQNISPHISAAYMSDNFQKRNRTSMLNQSDIDAQSANKKEKSKKPWYSVSRNFFLNAYSDLVLSILG